MRLLGKLGIVAISLWLAAVSAGAVPCAYAGLSRTALHQATSTVGCCTATKTAERQDTPDLRLSAMSAGVAPATPERVDAAANSRPARVAYAKPANDYPSLLCTFLI